MESINFTNSYVVTQASTEVDYIDFGFEAAANLPNNKTSEEAIGGSSKQAVVHYKDTALASGTYKVVKGAHFPEGALVTITGGGPDDGVIEAVDNAGNKAVWTSEQE
ncbi:hypothetical protein C8034_v005940 [Colletotrichum sidae]|uniref:Uncharacterized protein n=4 Tax=Colletotrichum orbiculare species complex TaxID=2707354 RepID=N4UXS9_COLOR|nr:hypothetical protein Cob_v001687 [Colletotrichum orbiculare MAFF 240422]TDZ38450.1 hypothetical protein C8035_v004691 [Colletotrichum spinosum]TDZ61452.1 hypothetical protein CTRI78_v004319 [Colletotrichum trifolii]TEA12682.1 hypothetical protein C8034_v005940 [Colletotrichum sidae]